MTNSERILKAAESNGGTITTEQVNEMNIHRTTLRTMVDKGLLDHSARGVYVLPAKLDDEFYNLQIRFKKGVFSNISALYLLGFTDRTPIRFDMTFPASYNTSSVKDEVIAHRVKKELYEKGVSGFKKSAKDRDAIQELQRDAVEGKFDILLVYMFFLFQQQFRYNNYSYEQSLHTTTEYPDRQNNR